MPRTKKRFTWRAEKARRTRHQAIDKQYLERTYSVYPIVQTTWRNSQVFASRSKPTQEVIDAVMIDAVIIDAVIEEETAKKPTDQG
jgi:hypothetical protein